MLILPAIPSPAVPPSRDAAAKLRSMVDDAAGVCVRTGGHDIVVCGHRPESSPYRLPEQFRGDQGFDIDGPIDSVARERHRMMDVGGAGALQNACSTTGGGGAYGCQLKEWQAADQQRGYRH